MAGESHISQRSRPTSRIDADGLPVPSISLDESDIKRYVRVITGAIKHYIGFSTEIKPRVGQMFNGATLNDTDLPIGSTMFEVDSHKLLIWDGTDWFDKTPRDPVIGLLEELIVELRLARMEAQEHEYV